MLKKIASEALRVTRTRALYKIRRSGALVEAGWFRSVAEQAAVDADGRPIPWMTYAAISFLAERARPHHDVFEYGSGNSTLWWAGRVRSLTAVEHHSDWYHSIKQQCPANVEIHNVGLDEGYVESILSRNRKFDIIVVDGRQRSRCVQVATQAIKSSGVIVFDNSQRPRYAASLAVMAEAGWRRIAFSGMAPISASNTETSILYRTDNCFGI